MFARSRRRSRSRGWQAALEYRSILLPVVAGPTSREAVHVAARLATKRGGRVELLRVIVVSAELPLDADFSEQIEEADALLASASAIAATYGVRAVARVVRARHAGRAIAEEAERRGVEIVVLGAPRSTHRAIFGHTVDYVLKHSPCRVMVAAGTRRGPTPEGRTVQETVRRILIPMKIGPIGDEMLATAVKLAAGHGVEVVALHAIAVPLELALDAPMIDEEEQAAAALAEAKLLGSECRVNVEGITVRTRSIGKAIVETAEKLDVDLIVLGSAPRWRRQSRFFSPTVDYVLRRAPCEVLIVAFPQSVLDEELAAI